MSSRPLRIAIVGAGPSGFYAADALLKELEPVSVDIIDRLPTPFGLVRYGVAPDHQKIKSVTRLYERTCQDERVRFLGNVTFGRDLTHDEIKRHYDAVIYTVGASADRQLGIPGEDLEGSLSATEFVAWYNGHPEFEDRLDKVHAERVVVVGMGNVAVDVTRILAKSTDELRGTDIADHALDVLEESPVTDIYMLGRRGPAQGKFTTKELRELGELANADIVVDEEELDVDEASLKSIEDNPALKKNLEVLRDFAQKPLEGKPRRVHLRFCVSPVEVMGAEKVAAVRLEKNRLEPTDSGYINAVGTGQFETLTADMVLRSVGYRGVPLPGIPFDERRGVIPNDGGQVLDASGGEPVKDEFVAGWIKRGPSGVIGTNKADSAATVKTLLDTVEPNTLSTNSNKTPEAVTQLLEQKNIDYVTFERWQALDAHELGLGEAQGRPRVKVVSVEKMLEHSRGEK